VSALQRIEKSSTAFLTTLWGPQPRGYAQVWTLADRRSTYLKDPAAAANFDGHEDVFCAVGMTTKRLGPRQRANAQQVAAIAGFWLDLDIGDAAGALPNRTAALSFANRHLRPTITVDSGHGVHAWYLLDDGPWYFTTRDQQTEAASLARRFVTLHQQSAATRGWRLDSVGDLARLMRLPGTLNAKEPDRPRPVTTIEHQGPRHALAAIRDLLHNVAVDEPSRAPASAAPVTLTGDTSAFASKLDALIANSPEFAARWEHTTAPADGSMSAYDLSLCSMAAGAMTDPELAQLITLHRATHGSADDIAKAQRTGYLASTIRRARSRTDRDAQIQALQDLGTRRAA